MAKVINGSRCVCTLINIDTLSIIDIGTPIAFCLSACIFYNNIPIICTIIFNSRCTSVLIEKYSIGGCMKYTSIWSFAPIPWVTIPIVSRMIICICFTYLCCQWRLTTIRFYMFKSSSLISCIAFWRTCCTEYHGSITFTSVSICIFGVYIFTRQDFTYSWREYYGGCYACITCRTCTCCYFFDTCSST